MEKILVVNPGSTSTKIGLFEGETQVFEQVIRHSREDLAQFEKAADQEGFRRQFIEAALRDAGVSREELCAVVGMGGLLRPVAGGTYLVNDQMLGDLKSGAMGDHASNLGGILAHEIAKQANIPAFIADPVVVDEMTDIARISGHPHLPRKSIFHALNQKAIARQYCREVGKRYEDVTVIAVHAGGGISVSLHQKGRVIDTNNALDGDGPFTPERSGGLPAGDLAALCFSGTYTLAQVKQMIKGRGGLVAYTGSNSVQELEIKANTDPEVRLLLEAMAYQIAKEIGALATVAQGQVDAILLTGGICYSKFITTEITKRVAFIAEVRPYPGEDELAALAGAALRVVRGEETAKAY